MTSNPDDKFASELDHTSQNIQPTTNYSADQIQMQVARKESSSGFMLLSVKHLSNVKQITTTNGREMNPLAECYNDSCVNKTPSLQMNYKTSKGNSLELGRQYSSTISLEAEEYDNDEEEQESRSEPHHTHLNSLVGFQTQSTIMGNPPSSYNPSRITNVNSHLGEQVADGLRPVAISNYPPVQVSSTTLPVQNSVAQSLHDTQPQSANEQFACLPNHPAAFRQLNSDVVLGTPIESPIPSGSMNPPTNLTGTQVQQRVNPEMPSFKYSDPSFDLNAQSAAITSQGSLLGHVTMSATLPQPATQSILEQMNGESLRSISDAPFANLLPSLSASVQPVSRFRKARIHETVEQWGSKRLSFHDCRLKAVPDWVSYLQTKPIDISFKHPIVQRGRCLYCFVPAGFGSKCDNPKHNQNGPSLAILRHRKAVSCSLPPVPESAELSHILQATFTAYRSATQQGFNLSSLLATWNAGERVSSHALLGQVDHTSLKSNLGLKANTSEPAILSDHVEFAAHNSADVNSVLSSGNEDVCENGITMLARCSTHYQPLPPLVEQIPHSAISPIRVNAGEGTGARVTDPSAAYLRRQLTLDTEAEEVVRIDGGISHPPPPSTLTIPSAIEQQTAPPTSPTVPINPTCVSRMFTTHVDCADAAVTSPKTLDNICSPSGTTIASAQLSPDTEVSGTAVLRVTDLPVNGSAALADSLSRTGNNMPNVLPFDANRLEGVSPLVGGTGEPIPQEPVGRSSGGAAATNTSSGAPVDLSTAARNIFQVAAAAAARVNSPVQASSQPTSTSTSVASNLEAQMPKCMDVIRLAIMETLQDQFVHLNSENEALRAAVNNLQHENHLLQGYKRAFFDLRPFFQPELWEQIEQHVRAVEAALASTASVESSSQQHFFPLSTQSSQPNSAFQAQPQPQPQHQSSSNLLGDAQYLPPPTSDKVDVPPPPQPQPQPPPNTTPQ